MIRCGTIFQGAVRAGMVLLIVCFLVSVPAHAYQVLWQKTTGLGQIGYVLTSYVHVLYPDIWQAAGPVQNLGADLDGDGIAEFVTWFSSDGIGHAYVIDGLTGEIEFEHTWNCPQGEYVQVIAYFDGDASDGVSEVLVATPATKFVISGRVSSGLSDLDPGSRAPLRSSAGPNPALESTSIAFHLGGDAQVEIGIFDVAGRRVRTLLQANMPAGEHVVSWDGRTDHSVRAAAGTYFARLEAGGEQVCEKIILLQ